MDIFIKKVTDKQLQSTNALWNTLGLNKAWNIGYISSLIKEKRFRNKSEWYNYYFETGKKRLELINKLSKEEQKLVYEKNPTSNKDINHLNLYYGRTKKELMSMGSYLYQEILKEGNPYQLDEVECQYMVFYRVVCETWNGIAIRENNTKEKLINTLKDEGYEILIIDTTGDFDCKYAVDFEIYHAGYLICGLQIKPQSYKGNKDYLETAREINRKKNSDYKEKYSRNVYYIYSKLDGEIENRSVILDIKRDIECFLKKIA